MSTPFRKRCQKVAADCGVEVYFFQDTGRITADQFEDDGNLHIRQPNGERACFDVGVGQSLDGAHQNANTRAVMKALRMQNKITDRVLVKEDDEEEAQDCCPDCGREY